MQRRNFLSSICVGVIGCVIPSFLHNKDKISLLRRNGYKIIWQEPELQLLGPEKTSVFYCSHIMNDGMSILVPMLKYSYEELQDSIDKMYKQALKDKCSDQVKSAFCYNNLIGLLNIIE